MNDMKCPYCVAEWEHDYDDLSYTEKEGEYECPSCERICQLIYDIAQERKRG